MLEEQLRAAYENEMAQLRAMDEQASSNETETLILRHDSLSYLGRLQEQVKEKRLQF
jgi:hypothetical protein